MKAVQMDSKTIVVYNGDNESGKLVYKNRFSSKARIVDPELGSFDIVPVNFWKTQFEVRKDFTALVLFKRKWNGVTHVKTSFGANEQEYTFRHKGTFNSRYLLMDKDEREMLVVKTVFIWKKFRYNYNIEVNESFRRRLHHLLLITLMVYLCKEHKSRQAAQGGAAAY